jgi:ketosteroid isomerase-like protein
MNLPCLRSMLSELANVLDAIMPSSARLALSCALLAIIASVAEGQQTAAGSADSVAVLISRYDRAWNARDTAAMNRFLAPGYQYFTSIGGLSSRAETLGFLGSPEYQLEHALRSEVTVRVSGPVAVASSRWQGRGRYRGERFTDDQRCGLVWLQTVAGWLLLSEHCTQIAPASAPSS